MTGDDEQALYAYIRCQLRGWVEQHMTMIVVIAQARREGKVHHG